MIDASALFAGAASARCPAIGFTAYGGAGDDTIFGSQAADYLAGGSGDDTIIGGRGNDQIYGDNGVNVDVITRDAHDPVGQRERVARTATTWPPASDLLHGDVAGGTASVAGEYDDVIFGDYGGVIQDVARGDRRRQPDLRVRPADHAAREDHDGRPDPRHRDDAARERRRRRDQWQRRTRPDLRWQRQRHDHRRRPVERHLR